METKYGLRGAISPAEQFKNRDESFRFGEFEIAIRDGVFEIGFNDSSEAGRARNVAEQHLAWFSLAHDIRYTVDLNQSWEVRPDSSKAFAVKISETVKVTADICVNTVTMQGSAFIISPGFDSAKLSSYSAQVLKAQNNPALAKSLKYYSEEVVDSGRPLYGVFKALEELCHVLGGRAQVAALVNRPEKYVSEVMETAQLTRHARSRARQLLSERECRERARILLAAYEKSI